jgi:hypothetical protein
MAYESGLAFLGLDNRTPPVKTAMGASAMGQDGLAAMGAGAPLRLCQRIVGAPLILDPLRGSSFRYRHNPSPIFLCVLTAAAFYE